MSLSAEQRATLVKLYLDKAWLTYQEAIIAAEKESWSMAANRLYYALFHATSALFVNDGLEVRSHRGIKAKLGQYYILTGKLSSDYSYFLAKMETLRDKADYNVQFVATDKDVIPNLPLAKDFIETLEKMIGSGAVS
ncbi:MAG: HEPN domain-containing protein [Bacteroidaceae bacterium]|nr:HEPN domain-containing protein [Bacteroidaceae bacterium]